MDEETSPDFKWAESKQEHGRKKKKIIYSFIKQLNRKQSLLAIQRRCLVSRHENKCVFVMILQLGSFSCMQLEDLNEIIVQIRYSAEPLGLHFKTTAGWISWCDGDNRRAEKCLPTVHTSRTNRRDTKAGSLSPPKTL